MKKNILKCLLGVSALLMLNACDKTDGALYTGAPNKVSFFSETTSVPMANGSLSVPVGRTSSSGELTVPITLTATGMGYTNVFTLEPVKFVDGSGKTYAKINYGDLSSIDPGTLSINPSGLDVNVGLAFPISLNIPDDNASVTNIKKVDVLASSALEFEDKGNVRMDSSAGWDGDANLSVKLQKAKGANVYKVVSPFGANSFAFMIKSDGTTVVFPNQVVATHATYGAVSMTSVTGTVSNKVVTLNVGGYRVSAGSFGAGKEIIYLP